MQELLWLDHLPESSIERGVALVNELYWNISVVEGAGKWCVLGGDKAIFCADSRDAVHAFLFGLSLAYAVLPEPVFVQLREEVRRWVE